MIHSIMVPTRGRRVMLMEMLASLEKTAHEPLELEVLIAYDSDDANAIDNSISNRYTLIECKPGLTLREKYAPLEEVAQGRLWWYAADDFLFQTPGWDVTISKQYEAHPDKHCVFTMMDGLRGVDSMKAENAVPGMFAMTREWTDAVGYALPPKFRWMAMDLWTWDLARRVEQQRPGHRIIREDITTTHRHHQNNSRPVDATDNISAPDFNYGVYEQYVPRTVERCEDAQKIIASIDNVLAKGKE